MSEPVHAASFTRTLRLKVKAEAYPWLNAAAVEVNQVFNWANATSIDAADRNRRAHTKFLSGFDLCYLSAGASEFFRAHRRRHDPAHLLRVCAEEKSDEASQATLACEPRCSPLVRLGALQGSKPQAQGRRAALLRQGFPRLRVRAPRRREVARRLLCA